MDSPTPSDFPRDSSTPVSRKRAKGALLPCDLTAEFMNDSLDQLFADDEFGEDSFNVCHSQAPEGEFPQSTPFRPVVPGEVPPPAPKTSEISPSSPRVKSAYTPFDRRSSPFRSTTSPLSQRVLCTPQFGSLVPFCQAGESKKFTQNGVACRVSSPVESAGITTPSCDMQVASLKSSQVSQESWGMASGIIGQLRLNVSSSASPARKRTALSSGLEEALRLQSQLAEQGPFFGLPSQVGELFLRHKGIQALYPWQRECLGLPAVRARRNLVYSLPTSGGKTLVAEVLLLRELLCHGRDAVFIMPYVSLVQEKVRGLSPFAVDLGFAIEECAGAKGAIPPRKRRARRALYACTIEKARALVDALCEAGRLAEVGLVAVDELHMVGEPGGRGAALESTLAKLPPSTQVVGMSATLANMGDLASFLRADVYRGDFRPVELREFVKVGDELFRVDGGGEWRRERTLDFGYTEEMRQRDPDMIAGLVREVIPQNACLVFCPTKRHCENLALTVSSLLPPALRQHRRAEKEQLARALREEDGEEACSVLLRCFPLGVAYHHGGLAADERRLVEEAFAAGVLCCLCCTSTLAAGVNLPAKRVILRAPYVGAEFITLSRYKQMAGRAGRAGLDTSGESVLVARPGERAAVEALLAAPLDVCRSNFAAQPQLVPPLVLSLAGLGLADTLAAVRAFWQRTLAAVQGDGLDERAVVDQLVYDGMLRWGEGERLVVTPLGKAAFKAGVDVATARSFLERLRAAMDGLVLHSRLHLLHLVTPDECLSAVPFSPEVLLQEFSALPPGELRAAEACGASERAVMLAAGGRCGRETRERLHRFQLTLVLAALWRQEGAARFGLRRGTAQALLSAAGARAAALAAFSAELEELWAFRALLPDLARQLSLCVSSELLPLMELPAVKRGRARQLHSAGFRTLAEVARASPQELSAGVPLLPLRQARQMVAAARMLLTEKAEALRDEAQDVVEEFEQNCSMLEDIPDSPTAPQRHLMTAAVSQKKGS